VIDITQELKDKHALGGDVFALLSGYPASCFARITADALLLPPGFEDLQPEPFALPWTLFYDIRVFGETGEWHAWCQSGARGRREWSARFRRFDDINDRIEREYPILGTRVVERRNGWALRREQRGPAVWVPESIAGDAESRPVLRVWQILGVEPDSNGIMGVVDAAVAGFGVRKEGTDE
jgi:hypothetical protein